MGATAIAATVPDPKVFRSGRDFAAWIGIVPREDSTGGKHKLGPISKRGDQYLRRILVVGAHAVLKRARHQPEKYPWVTRLLERKPFRVVAAGGCQQDGARCLGIVGQGRQLSGACVCGSGVRGMGESRVSLRLCAYELQGDDDVDAKRSRPSIGKTRDGPRDT